MVDDDGGAVAAPGVVLVGAVWGITEQREPGLANRRNEGDEIFRIAKRLTQDGDLGRLLRCNRSRASVRRMTGARESSWDWRLVSDPTHLFVGLRAARPLTRDKKMN